MVLPNSKFVALVFATLLGMSARTLGSAASGTLPSPAPDRTAAGSGATRAGPSACPAEMQLAAGSYCPEVEHTCKAWMDPPPYQNLRCSVYAPTARCTKPRVDKRVCVDREEHIDAGETLPTVSVSFVDAKATCAKEGKRLCKEDEWQFACEGEDMRPYPYGFNRDSSACNIDQTKLGTIGNLRDLRAPAGAYERCLSPFGVHNMTGNVDEWVERDGTHPSVLHGGWWLPGRNRCRATTAEHGPDYTAKQVGFRCCKDAAP